MYFSVVGGISGFFPLTILGLCLAGTAGILDQGGPRKDKSNDLKDVNEGISSLGKDVKKLTNLQDVVTATLASLEVGSDLTRVFI